MSRLIGKGILSVPQRIIQISMKEQNMSGIVETKGGFSGLFRRSRLPAVTALGLWSALLGLACAPDLPNEEPTPFVELQFDPSATPAKSFEPTSLIINASTQLLDFGEAGIDVPGVPEDASEPVDPTACQGQTKIPVAQCEFYQYLERLDGFPTLTPALTPVSAPLKLSTVKVPQNLFVYNISNDQTVTDVNVAFDTATSSLVFDPKQGWDVGGVYVVGIRGYTKGVKSEKEAEGVASIIYALLKQDRSLTCGATSANGIYPTCDFYSLFSTDPGFSKLSPKKMREAIAETLLQLEQLRQLYRGKVPGMPINVWDILADKADMPKDEVAIAWTFPIHTASVVELDPTRGLAPRVVSSSEIRLAVKGSIDAATLKPFSLSNSDGMSGTVFLLNVEKLNENKLDQALPPFSAAFEGGDIVLTGADPNNPFIEGATYAILITTEVTNADGKPLVASPVTVLLRSRGELVDGAGTSQVSGVSDTDAQQLEQGRMQFKELLDDPTIKVATLSANRPKGLTREMLVYLYGFPLTTAQ
jgi:hypothetical protein